MLYYIILKKNDNVLQNTFATFRDAELFARQNNLTPEDCFIVDERYFQQQPQDNRKEVFQNSIIKKPFQPREQNMRVPIQSYNNQKAPNHTCKYQSFKPHFAKKKNK